MNYIKHFCPGSGAIHEIEISMTLYVGYTSPFLFLESFHLSEHKKNSNICGMCQLLVFIVTDLFESLELTRYTFLEN